MIFLYGVVLQWLVQKDFKFTRMFFLPRPKDGTLEIAEVTGAGRHDSEARCSHVRCRCPQQSRVAVPAIDAKLSKPQRFFRASSFNSFNSGIGLRHFSHSIPSHRKCCIQVSTASRRFICIFRALKILHFRHQ